MNILDLLLAVAAVMMPTAWGAWIVAIVRGVTK